MRELMYEDGDLAVFKEDSKFFIRYDAGAHQIAMREDEISEQEAMQVMKGASEATQVLFALQRRLTLAGVNPYVSNV